MKFWTRLWRRAKTAFPTRVVSRYSKVNGPLWATAIGWNLLFAFFPIALVVATIIGVALQGTGLDSSFQHAVGDQLPGKNGQLLIEGLHSFRRAGGWLAIASFIGLVWSGSSLFGTVKQALDALRPGRHRGFVAQHAISIAMVLLLAVIVIAALSSSVGLVFLQKASSLPGWISQGAGGILIQLVLGSCLGTLLFLTIFRVLPSQPAPRRALWLGALTAGVGFELLSLLFPLYLSLQKGFSTYGATLGLFFVALTYAYLIAQVTMIGATVTAELAGEEGGPPHVSSKRVPNAAQVPKMKADSRAPSHD